MSDQFDVVVVGEINADLILSGNVMPEFNQVEKIIANANLVMGSSAVIFACGCARLGLKTTFIGMVGDDFFGRFMVEAMNDRGIDTSGVRKDPSIGTGLSVILVTNGDRAILTYPGAIPELRMSDIDLNVIKQSRHLHLSSYYLLENLRADVPKLFDKAKKFGLSVSLDTNYDPSEMWSNGLDEALQYVNVFLPNDTEAKAISGLDNIPSALKKLSESVSSVVIKLGGEGAIGISQRGTIVRQKTVPTKVVDTVGAGDSFDAGYIYGYLQDWPLEESIRLAVACGTLSTLAPGGTTGQATLEQAHDFVERNLLK